MYYPREAERDNLYNRIILLTLVSIIVLGIAAMAMREGGRYALLRLSPVETFATITQIESLPRNSSAAIIHFRYTDQSGHAHDAEYLDTRYGEQHRYVEGGPVALVYCDWFPSINSLAEQLNHLRPGFFIMTGGVLIVLVLFGLSLLTFWRMGRMSAEDVYY
jgi:hypothetical protein